MNSVAQAAFSIMQRPSPPPTPSTALKPSGPSPPPQAIDTNPSPPSPALNTATASASASAAGNDEPLVSPVAGSGAQSQGTVNGLTLPSYARAVRDGTLGVTAGARPPLGPRQGSAAPGAQDSMNLGPGQLRQIMPAAPRQKQVQYDFRYDDTDNLLNELQEFFAYGEMSQLGDNERAYREDYDDIDWTKQDKARRKMYTGRQLELLEHRDIRERIQAARRLSYIVEGTFAYTNSPEHQLHWVIENSKLLRECDAVPAVLQALRSASNRHDLLTATTEFNPRSSFSNGPPGHPNTHPLSPGQNPEIQGQIDEICMEIGLYLGILYFVIEVFRGDDALADELMALDTPLPIFLMNTVTSLREKTSKGYPVKKLLLLLWKTILACLGGLKDVKEVMVMQREKAGLAPSTKDFTKVSPVSLDHFRKDTSIKYPTFQAYNSAIIPTEKLAEAVKPMPLRSHYHSDMDDVPRSYASRPQNQQGPGPGPAAGQQQPGTPAPSPPTTPQMKPKKQMYQTDPTRPFVFPFSRFDADPLRLVPFAIDEADKLYNKHMHVSLGIYQLWQTRDEFIREESGLGKSGLIGFTKSMYLDDDEDEDLEDEAWDEFQMADWKLEEEENRHASAGNTAEVAKVKKARLGLKKLYRVEVIYRGFIPIAQSYVVVLLKLLLATVTSPTGAPGPPAPGSPVAPDANVEAPAPEAAPPATMEEVDIMRHREITSKAVSAIILLLLKWMKASHVIKFQHLSTHLVDSNCLLLVLKMFGFQELMSTVVAKNEWEDHNFFRYCYLNFSRDKSTGPEDDMLNPVKKNSIKTLPGGEEIELLGDYAWRNFFFAINFVRVMHQLTKQRPARIALLVQYKSTQILKRMLRVPHPMLQLQILKVIKSQVPSCGRKWRSSNMKTITAVYLNCRPDLRDDWLAATDVDSEVEASNASETALRTLIRFYDTQRYSKYVNLPRTEPGLRRSISMAGEGPPDGTAPQSGSFLHRSDSDIFPPNRTRLERRSEYSADLDGMMGAWLYEYEDLIGDLLGTGGRDGMAVPSSPSFSGAATRNDPAWARLDAIIRGRGMSDEESISDSESIVSIGELGPDARYQESRVFGDPEEHASAFDNQDSSIPDENENTWAHISDHALSLLPKSPEGRARRRSSSGSAQSPLRPVMASSTEWLDTAVDDEEEDDFGPMPVQEGTADKQERMNAPVDEVEYLESMEG